MENVINEFDRIRNNAGFAKFLWVLQFSVKTFNRFKQYNIFTKYPILDV